ncbi:hypothetical protein MPDQ_001354 [Monascus purpureus]|uniref:Uncharacterized protein n=1 Tax=Monascus purpureus TaxID=5098 RepID=A0A507QS50_MONPU|nr:hypothetical protein MPDQ_001354 [Monascus purpureus]BDD61294.1 hypothetical protein MAP00_006350 [Monascus purpureus]
MAPAKPVLPPLKTPKNSTFPSEIHDGGPGAGPHSANMLKSPEGQSTPITPPVAYTEFLKALTPVFSPLSAGASFPSLQIERTRDGNSSNATTWSASQPSSAVSGSFSLGSGSLRSVTSPLPPPTPCTAPLPAGAGNDKSRGRGLRHLRIPPSLKLSPTAVDSPRSATSIRSPFSPSTWKLRYSDSPWSAGPTPVSVRQVITRTVTFKRTQLEAPPKGKRRKCPKREDSEDPSKENIPKS